MSETGQMIAETAGRILEAHCTADRLREAEGGWSAALWAAAAEAGLPLALEPEGAGAFGIPASDALAVVQAIGRHAAPAPLVEAMFGNWLLLAAGMEAQADILSVAGLDRADRLALRASGSGWTLSGSAARVPWGREAQALVVLVETEVGTSVALVRGGYEVATGENMAREPRDRVAFDVVLPAEAVAPLGRPLIALRALAAGLRVAQMAGALQKILELTVGYAQERVQFGRPIGKFQAVQQNIAVMGGQVAAARAAATMVASDFGRPDATLALAAAKIRAGEAAGIAAGYAHQVHGAIGFTQEYELHFLTKRLWSWRDDYGTEAEWSRLLGEAVCRRGADAMWPFITAGLIAPEAEVVPISAAGGRR